MAVAVITSLQGWLAVVPNLQFKLGLQGKATRSSIDAAELQTMLLPQMDIIIALSIQCHPLRLVLYCCMPLAPGPLTDTCSLPWGCYGCADVTAVHAGLLHSWGGCTAQRQALNAGDDWHCIRRPGCCTAVPLSFRKDICNHRGHSCVPGLLPAASHHPPTAVRPGQVNLSPSCLPRLVGHGFGALLAACWGSCALTHVRVLCLKGMRSGWGVQSVLHMPWRKCECMSQVCMSRPRVHSFGTWR